MNLSLRPPHLCRHPHCPSALGTGGVSSRALFRDVEDSACCGRVLSRVAVRRPAWRYLSSGRDLLADTPSTPTFPSVNDAVLSKFVERPEADGLEIEHVPALCRLSTRPSAMPVGIEA